MRYLAVMTAGFIGLLAAAFSLSVSGSSYARDPRWVKAAENASSIDYYDPEHVTRNGNLVYVWVLQDKKAPSYSEGQAYQSIIARDMYNCVSEFSQAQSLTIYSGRMGMAMRRLIIG